MNDRARALRAAALYHDEGLTLAEIGAELGGISRERVRQLLKWIGRPSSQTWTAARRRRWAERSAEAREAELARLDERREEALALYRSGGGSEGLAEALGVSHDAAGKWLTRNLSQEERDRVRGDQISKTRGTVPDEELLGDLREAAAALGEMFSEAEYSDWAKENGRRGAQTHPKRFGSWNEARRLAGLPTRRSGKRHRIDRVSEEACWAALRRVAAELGHPPTVEEYEEAAHRAGLPSVATVRTRLGQRWVALKWRAAPPPGVLLGEPAPDQEVGLPVGHPEPAE